MPGGRAVPLRGPRALREHDGRRLARCRSHSTGTARKSPSRSRERMSASTTGGRRPAVARPPRPRSRAPSSSISLRMRFRSILAAPLMPKACAISRLPTRVRRLRDEGEDLLAGEGRGAAGSAAWALMRCAKRGAGRLSKKRVRRRSGAGPRTSVSSPQDGCSGRSAATSARRVLNRRGAISRWRPTCGCARPRDRRRSRVR